MVNEEQSRPFPRATQATRDRVRQRAGPVHPRRSVPASAFRTLTLLTKVWDVPLPDTDRGTSPKHDGAGIFGDNARLTSNEKKHKCSAKL